MMNCRCEANVASYGKPTSCIFCQLPAAFVGKIFSTITYFSAFDSLYRYRVFFKYCIFYLQFCDFSELCQFLQRVRPAIWHSKHEVRSTPIEAKIRIIFFNLRKKTLFDGHPVVYFLYLTNHL